VNLYQNLCANITAGLQNAFLLCRKKTGGWLPILCTTDAITCSLAGALANQCQLGEEPSDPAELFTFRSPAFVSAF
jgi:hypothetical protein